MSVIKLYEICLIDLLKNSFLNLNNFNQLPNSCLRDILPYLSPYKLEYLDHIYYKRGISINDFWRHHFELIWSLSRDDKDSYESLINIPYKRLYFEYLFHDTQILQLGIYTHILQINQSKSILNLTYFEQMKYNLTRDSIIYCSKKRLLDENQNLIIIWNHQWNKYIKRFILVPNVWNLANIDSLLIECFTDNVTDIVLSGYPTENDINGMKFILDILTRGHITNIVIKFPSYCLMNILLPLFIYPRSYSLSYFSTMKENDVQQSNIFTQNFILPHRKRKLCLQVQIHSMEKVLSTNHEFIEDNDQNSTDTILSNSIHSLHNSNSLSTNIPIHSSILGMRNELIHIPSDSLFQTNNESSHLVSLTDNNRSIIEQPHERLLSYLNRSRTFQQYSIFPPARHLSISEQSVPITNITTESHSSSDSNLFQRHRIKTVIPEKKFSERKKQDEEKFLIFHLTEQYQINSLTNLSIYYISSIEIIDMLAIALLGMNQIHHLTFVNFAVYSSQLETSLITLCTRSQLQSIYLTSISLEHGAIGFLLNLYEKNKNINLKRIRLDAIKTYNNIHLSDIEQTEFIQNSVLEQFIWRERHMQYIHMRLLYKLLPNIISNLHRLELSSILECVIFDQFLWCQTFLHHIPDVRLRNFRIRSNDLSRFFLALNTPNILTVFHFERIGLTWNNNQQSSIIYNAFTSLILNAKYLKELSLAYNNLNDNFIQWLCQILLLGNNKKISWWSITILNLTFNLLSSESIRKLCNTLKEYRDQWRIGCSPIRRIDILGNALEMREISNLKKQFNALGCELISYILT
ncbi:unnamed protein product [Adineta steineri]|uniref:Uncharacterized protein n=1 Tax=Adineta steineri TaxID=433720 RepID=A0A819GFA1_9BILA|nr:unnamed protein product [Adineta steineri]